jgi:choline dehydrogenase
MNQTGTNMGNTNGELANRIHANQEKIAAGLGGQFDVVVCGAGSSGSVIAGRLAADPDVKVLLLEAGDSDELEQVMDPNLWASTLGSDLDWGFVAESNPHLNGRAIPYSMGKVLGGGSSINVSVWSRGHQANWDGYAAETDDPSWGYDAILDLYRRRIEDWTGSSDPKYRGSGGPVHVQPAADPHPFSIAVLDAAESAGLPRFENMNGRIMEAARGCAIVDETVRDRRRQSIFRAYAYPRMGQPNLTVLTGTLVTRIVFERQRATAVEFRLQGKLLRAEAATEVIVSLGAIQTPKLLMQSGIGDEAELREHDIPVVQHLAGVGRNLHDHVSLGCMWEATGKSLPSARRSQAASFWKTDPALGAPNLFMYATGVPYTTPENQTQFRPPATSWSLVVGMSPASRGSIHLTGPNPSDPLEIQTNYLADPSDLKDLMLGIEQAREIGNAAGLQSYRKREVAPGNQKADLERFIRNGLSTYWHQCGTAKMGRDAMSVVDGKLKVYGIDRLRVAGAPILPRVTTGNTMAPCVAIGERAAAMLQEEYAMRSHR